MLAIRTPLGTVYNVLITGINYMAYMQGCRGNRNLWEFPWENPQSPIWDENGNDFKPMGIPTSGFLWVSMGFL